jgi:hypothetical protein
VSDQKPPQPPGPGEEPSSGSGYPPPSGAGSVYESSSYQQQPDAQEQAPPPASGAPTTPPPPGSAPPGSAPPGSAPPGSENAYPPGAYPQQGAYAAPGPPRNNTQLFGILGIVFAVVCCPLLGVLFGWLSMNEAKKTGSDETLGKVGFWLGIAFTAIGVVSAVIAICAGGLSGWNTRY